MSQLSPHHPSSPIRAQDLQHYAHLVPPSGRTLLRMLGDVDGLTVINCLGGVQVTIPKGPCNVQGAWSWAYLCKQVGQDITTALSIGMGGECLEVPTLDALRTERRNHTICAEFDRLTARAPGGEGLSKARAVQVLVLTHGPITHRQIETILDRPTPEPVRQTPLFSQLFY